MPKGEFMKIIEKDGLTLYFKKKEVIKHTAKNPFACLLNWDLKYKSSHGNFKVKDKVKKSIPLEKYQILKKSDDNIKIKFFSGELWLILDITVTDGVMNIYFDSSQKDFSYKFNVPFNNAKGVFGGGEQYRKLNLKGERVVNFVSEHITVKPIIQKTILSFMKYKEKEHKDIQTYSPLSSFVFDKMFAVRFDSDGYGVFDFNGEDFFTTCLHECPKKLDFIAENSFSDIGKKLAQDTPNKQYLPDWCYDGMILGVQGGIERAKQKAFNMIDKGAKV